MRVWKGIFSHPYLYNLNKMLTEAQFTTEFNLLRKQNFWNQFDNNQLKIILGTMIAAGLTGSGGGTATSPADIAAGINQSTDLDTLLQAIADINGKIPKGGYESKVTITRLANTTPYLANSVWGGIFELTNFGASGGHVILSGVRVIFSNTTSPAGMGQFTLFLYSGTPPSAVVDGGSFSISTIDRSRLLTPKGVDLENAEAAIGGGSVVLQTDNKNVQIKLAAGVTSVWGYLVNRSAHNPVSGTTAELTALMLGV
jgi:hypothetical protein